ncbi:MAG: methionyl-tRNA formyltransferase [Lachnospiraceae bacterium]|nr:methionyl-tRNA formyltransferase [Lachnospiraceae bacterium]
MKIVFMGTPDFASCALEALIAAGHEITAVYTQPDKPKGRGKEVQMTPVKEVALKHDIPVYQPRRIKEAEEVAKLKEIPADIFVVAAFGQILSQEILDMPKYGCVNIHASLLPKYRGAAPIQWAVIDGEEKTGVTIQQMEAGIDTGDILYKKEYILDAKETGASLFDKLMVLGAEAIVEVLPLIEAGKITPVSQKEEEATHAAKLTKQLGEMDFTKSAVVLERLIRGLNSWPSAYTTFRSKQLKIWEAEVVPEVPGKPGTVVAVDKQSFTVATGEGSLKILELQIEGKKRMPSKDFLLGYPVSVGEILGR